MSHELDAGVQSNEVRGKQTLSFAVDAAVWPTFCVLVISLLVYAGIEVLLHVRIVWVVNLLFSLTHLSEGLAVRSRAENDVFILRLDVSCSELVCAEVSVLVLGLAEECSQVSVLSGLLNDFKLLRLGLVLEAA